MREPCALLTPGFRAEPPGAGQSADGGCDEKGAPPPRGIFQKPPSHHTKPTDSLECPCGWRITAVEFEALRYTVNCPRCKRPLIAMKTYRITAPSGQQHDFRADAIQTRENGCLHLLQKVDTELTTVIAFSPTGWIAVELLEKPGE